MRLETAVRRRLKNADDPLLRELALRLARAIETAPDYALARLVSALLEVLDHAPVEQGRKLDLDAHLAELLGGSNGSR